MTLSWHLALLDQVKCIHGFVGEPEEKINLKK